MTIEIRKIHPLAAAYELTPGSIYVVQVPGASVEELQYFGRHLDTLGIRGVTVAGKVAVEIFKLETTTGAALAVQCGKPIRDGDDFCHKAVGHGDECGYEHGTGQLLGQEG